MKKLFFVFIIFISSLFSQKEIIATDNAPKAIGPYSQAIKFGNFVFVSGQIALNPQSGQLVEGGIEEQTHQAMKNIEAILLKANVTFDDVLQVQVYLKDLNDYSKFNEIYAQYFSGEFPARAVVEVSRLPRNALVEIMVTAGKF